MAEKKRDTWSGTIGFILAGLGSAIGLGNIWRFPYMTGTNGGGAFVLIYIISALLIGLPILIAEIYIGQKSQKNVFSAFHVLKPSQKAWGGIGILSIATVLTILSFYAVVGGWVFEYMFYAIIGKLSAQNLNGQTLFSNILVSPIQGIIWTLIFMGATAIIVINGIRSGIEKYSKVLMPVLFIMMFILLIWSFFLPGISDTLSFLFKPDFSKLTPKSVLAAIGQAFFSLSLGMGTFITYGSYLEKNKSLGKTSLYIIFGDTLVAIFAGLIVFSVTFSFGYEPSGGPGLLFETLPPLFNQIPFGYVLVNLFFFLVGFATITSSISILETAVTFFTEQTKKSRTKITIILTIILGVISSICSLSFNVLANHKLFGKFNVFDFLDLTSNYIFLPLGGILIALFFGWVLGKAHVYESIKTDNKIIKFLLLWSLRLIIPIGIGFVLVEGLYAFFK